MKKSTNEKQVVSCLGGYHPRIYDSARKKGMLIKVKGKSKEKLIEPRAMHRTDCRKYVLSNGWTKNNLIKNPRFTNAGKSSVIRKVINVFWENIFNDEIDNVVGSVNVLPISKYHGFEKVDDGSACLLRNECSFCKEGCACFWLPNQIVTWGHFNGNDFVPLEHVIRSPWVTIDKLCKLLNINITPGRLMGILKRMQRTSCGTASPVGLGLHQFATVVETKYMEDLMTVYVCMAVGQRDPEVETWRDANKRLGGDNKKPTSDSVKEKINPDLACEEPVEKSVEKSVEKPVDAFSTCEDDVELINPDEIQITHVILYGDDDDDNY